MKTSNVVFVFLFLSGLAGFITGFTAGYKSAEHALQDEMNASYQQSKANAIGLHYYKHVYSYDKGYKQGWSDAHCGKGLDCEAGQE